MSILVTGGTGYIGSHTCVDFIEKGQEVVIMDNLCNSKIEVLDYIEKITGIRPKFYECDLLDKEGMNYAMSILKSAEGDDSSCERFTYAYSNPLCGRAKFIHTYNGDGDPLRPGQPG